jgi:hypothetical protein
VASNPMRCATTFGIGSQCEERRFFLIPTDVG